MLKVLYFLVLGAASVEDFRYHTVKPRWTILVFLLGVLNLIWTKENRWVTLALTCACFILLYLLYKLVLFLAARNGLAWSFGGADVRLIPGMMLVQGWDMALSGVFTGFVLALFYYALAKEKKELPLVPWMTAGCFFVELITIVKLL
ncbi:MAG: prepilin peptidase [Lachnospiraceae bacterium]|nr:prepilin peptidase [Lachnospiraceae bacterium]